MEDLWKLSFIEWGLNMIHCGINWMPPYYYIRKHYCHSLLIDQTFLSC